MCVFLIRTCNFKMRSQNYKQINKQTKTPQTQNLNQCVFTFYHREHVRDGQRDRACVTVWITLVKINLVLRRKFSVCPSHDSSLLRNNTPFLFCRLWSERDGRLGERRGLETLVPILTVLSSHIYRWRQLAFLCYAAAFNHLQKLNNRNTFVVCSGAMSWDEEWITPGTAVV